MKFCKKKDMHPNPTVNLVSHLFYQAPLQNHVRRNLVAIAKIDRIKIQFVNKIIVLIMKF